MRWFKNLRDRADNHGVLPAPTPPVEHLRVTEKDRAMMDQWGNMRLGWAMRAAGSLGY